MINYNIKVNPVNIAFEASTATLNHLIDYMKHYTLIQVELIKPRCVSKMNFSPFRNFLYMIRGKEF